MEFQNIELFITLSWVLILTPGPDQLYVLTRGISGGKKAGLISALGINAGILVHTLFAALGLSVILQTSATAFLIIKGIGAVYLIYLGIKTWLNKEEIKPDTNSKFTKSQLFIQGILSNVLNPKVALFFIAFLPQFVSANSTSSAASQMIILGLLFTLFGLIFLVSLGLSAGSVQKILFRNPKTGTLIHKISGLIMVLLGVRLAFTRK
ncbi:MAG: LysE family translocator [Bacteroidota bacterium]